MTTSLAFWAGVSGVGLVLLFLGIWLAVRYGGQHPLRAAWECASSLFNLAIGRPIYLAYLRHNDIEEWETRRHSPEYVAAVNQALEELLSLEGLEVVPA